MERQSLTDQQLQTVLRSPRLPDCSSSTLPVEVIPGLVRAQTLPAGDAAEALLPWFGGGQARATCVTPAGKGSATTRRSTTYSEREASTSSRGAPERRPGAAAVLGRPAPGAPTRTAPASRRPRTDWSEASIAKGVPGVPNGNGATRGPEAVRTLLTRLVGLRTPRHRGAAPGRLVGHLLASRICATERCAGSTYSFHPSLWLSCEGSIGGAGRNRGVGRR